MDEGRTNPASQLPTEPLPSDTAPPPSREGTIDKAIGSVLPGTRYRLDRLLGDGGAGQVFQGTHLELDKPVAIKILHGSVSHDDDYSARFRREAKAASSIRHPGVVAVTDFGTADDGRLFLVMELIEGQTLAEAIQHGPFRPSRAIRIAANLCGVLEAVHRAGIVHRDLKPANIFLLENDEVKVVDFGIARVGALGGADWRVTRTGKVVGTPGYMAPEHARAQEVDGRADLYSVGAVLYEMLTAAAPFRGSSPVDVLMAQMVHRPEPPSKLARKTEPQSGADGGDRERVPREADRVVRRLLAVKPDDRFRSAAEVSAVLRDLLDQMSGRPGDGGLARALAGRNRRILLFLAAAISVAALLVGAIAGFVLTGNTAERRDALSAPPPATDDGVAASLASRASENDVAASPVPPSAPQVVETLAEDVSAGLQEPEPPVADAASSTAPEADQVPQSTPSPRDASVDQAGRRVPIAATHREETPRVRQVDAPAPSAETPRNNGPAQPQRGDEDRRDASREVLRRARIAAASSRYAEAERLYEQAQAQGADRAAVLSGLGQVALARGQHVRAARLIEQALSIRPGSTRLLVDLGRAYQGAGQTARAVEQWRAVLRRDPDNAQAQRFLRNVGASPTP